MTKAEKRILENQVLLARMLESISAYLSKNVYDAVVSLSRELARETSTFVYSKEAENGTN